MVRGFAGRGQTGATALRASCIGKATLLFGGLGLTDVRKKAGIGCAVLSEVDSRFLQAQLAVHGEPDFGGVTIFLPVVFPPANRTQNQCAGDLQCFVSAARAAVTHFDRRTHKEMDGEIGARDYGRRSFQLLV